MDHDSARIDAGASVPFALLVMDAIPRRCHTRADEVSNKLMVRMNGCQAVADQEAPEVVP